MSYQPPKKSTFKEDRIFDPNRWIKDLDLKEEPFITDKSIIENDLDKLSLRQKQGQLAMAVKKKDTKAVKIFFDNTEIDPNFYDKKGMTPLHYAVYYGQFEIVCKLLYYGAENKFMNNTGSGETPVEAGRYSIDSNKKNKKYERNNQNIERCIKAIENNKKNRINIPNEDQEIKKIRENLNKLQEENKEEILKLISGNITQIIHNYEKIESVFEMIFKMASMSDIFLTTYVNVCETILQIEMRTYYKPELKDVFIWKDIFMKLIYRNYLETLENPTSHSNKNIIKFILHLHKKKLFKIGVIIKLIDDLFTVIEDSRVPVAGDPKKKEFKEEECIPLLQIILQEIRCFIKTDIQERKEEDQNLLPFLEICNNLKKYTKRFEKFKEPPNKIKFRTQVIIDNYLEEKI
jgi:hypothetical protein